LFYHNEVSAYGAGVLMTLAATCVSCDVNPLKYFTALIENREAVTANPDAWLPWGDWSDQSQSAPSSDGYD
jgi:hypothetical protein